jgi:hypothetical protein
MKQQKKLGRGRELLAVRARKTAVHRSHPRSVAWSLSGASDVYRLPPMPPHAVVQQEYEMWNSMNAKSLAVAVLITVVVQGSLLWQMNDMAVEGASGRSQTAVSSALTAPTQSFPEIRHITLEPVLVVGKRSDAIKDDIRTVQASALTSAAPGLCENTANNASVMSRQKNGEISYC